MTKDDFISGLNTFYHNYVIDTLHGTFQVFQSFTYGDMIISFLLLAIFLLQIFKWCWEVLR